MATSKRPQITVGTCVAYSRDFLHSICQLTEGEMPFMRGRVLAIEPLTNPNAIPRLAAIQWDGGRLSCVNIRHLVREDRLHLESV